MYFTTLSKFVILLDQGWGIDRKLLIHHLLAFAAVQFSTIFDNTSNSKREDLTTLGNETESLLENCIKKDVPREHWTVIKNLCPSGIIPIPHGRLIRFQFRFRFDRHSQPINFWVEQTDTVMNRPHT